MTPEELKSLRATLNLTQPAMAARLGMSHSGYRKYEAGDRKISGPVLVLLKQMEDECHAEKNSNMA